MLHGPQPFRAPLPQRDRPLTERISPAALTFTRPRTFRQKNSTLSTRKFHPFGAGRYAFLRRFAGLFSFCATNLRFRAISPQVEQERLRQASQRKLKSF